MPSGAGVTSRAVCHRDTPGVASVRVSVQGQPKDRAPWLALAREVELTGFEALYVAGHPGSVAAPFVALSAAAAVTDRIRVGTCVANAGMWEPASLANEIATLDVVSGGRAVLGVGAGHTPQRVGFDRSIVPFARRACRPDDRAGRCCASALLAGDTVSHRGTHFTLVHAALANPRPVQNSIPLLICGNGARVLR